MPFLSDYRAYKGHVVVGGMEVSPGGCGEFGMVIAAK